MKKEEINNRIKTASQASLNIGLVVALGITFLSKYTKPLVSFIGTLVLASISYYIVSSLFTIKHEENDK